MVFSSVVFLSLFLPATLMGYYLIGVKRKRKTVHNIWLLLVSLSFYIYGATKFVFIMLGLIFVNYCAALMISSVKNPTSKCRKWILAIDITINLLVLFIYKYLDFAILNINRIFLLFGREYEIPLQNIVLPIGISFFTFQAMSYVIDVYRGDGKVQKNPLNVALYVSFFPQLVAGPIVRYQTVAEELENRKETIDDFSRGIERFVIGLAKKVILANHLALLADQAFLALTENRLTVLFSWLGALAYTLQIYFDFSGYSDMAIGLGLMFGFHFNENFDHPYMSGTITEFWRRWHISLGSWFRDYVYIPLGGNRVTVPRLVLNLFVVWLLTGIWHGAGWTYVIWGMMHFALIAAEKLLHVDQKLKKAPVCAKIYRVFLLLYIALAWVVFRADDISIAVQYMKAMFALGTLPLTDRSTFGICREFWLILAASILCSIDWKPFVKMMQEKVRGFGAQLISAVKIILFALLALVSFSFLTISSYNPFIYFNF